MVYFNKTSIKYFVASSILVVATLLYFLYDNKNPMIPVYALVLNLLFLLKFRKSLPVFLLLAFFALYTYEAIKANNLGIPVSAWKGYNTTALIHKVILLNAFFIYSFGNMLSLSSLQMKMSLDKESLKSVFLFWLLLGVGVLMIQFGISGDTIFEAGEYGHGNVQRSTMHEYFVLVYFLLLLVAPRGLIYTLILVLILGVYVIKTILYGGRVEAMEIVLLFTLYYWILERKENTLLIYSIALVGYYISNVFQFIRSNPLPLLRGDFAVYLNPFLQEDSIPREYLASNQGDVLQASARFLGLLEDGYITLYQRATGFFYMLLSVVTPSSMAPDHANLSLFRRDVAGAGGGGMISSYFYIWMGYFGPFFIGAFLAYFINKGFTSQRIGYKVYAVMLLVMFPRWYVYNPLIIFKFCFLTVVMYQFVRLIFSVFFSRSSPVFQKIF